MRKLIIAFLVTMMTMPVVAQNTEYLEMSKEVDQEVWGDKDPIFEASKLPAEFKNESAVILARKQTVETNTERKGRSLLYIGKMHSLIKRTIREKIFINDQSSLDAYSQINFYQLQSKQSGPITKLRTYTFMGIRVIKADGTMQKVNVDEAAVKIDENSAGSKNKIAVPNLAIGDILDYYITYFDQARADKDVDYFSFVLGDEYPLMNLKIKVLLDKRVAAQYQVINGAPDFKITKVEDDDNLLEMAASNLPKSTNVMWTLENRQIPIVRIKYAFADIVHGRGDYTKRGVIEKVTAPDDVEHEFVNLIKPYLSKVEFVDQVKPKWKLYAREHNIEKDNMDSIIPFVYYFYRNREYGGLPYDNGILNTNADQFKECIKTKNKIKQLEMVLEVMKTINSGFDADAELVLISGTNEVNYKDIFTLGDFNFLLRVPKAGKYVFYYFGSNLYNFTEIPYFFENETYRFMKQNTIFRKGADMSQSKADQVNGKDVMFRSAAADNKQLEELIIETDSSNIQLLNIKRRSTATGHQRRDLQRATLIMEDYLTAEAKIQGNQTDLLRNSRYQHKSYKGVLEAIEQSMAKARTEQKSRFEEELTNEYLDKPKELKNYKILQDGFSGMNASTSIEVDFSMDGWIKKAGNNYIIEAGKFVGRQLEIKADQRDRKLDIYMPFARSFTNKVTFKIPDGYTVEGLEKLNKTVKNECGGFESSAKVEGNNLVITYDKYYSNLQDPASNWEKIMAFVDAGFAFTKEKLLLKKK